MKISQKLDLYYQYIFTFFSCKALKHAILLCNFPQNFYHQDWLLCKCVVLQSAVHSALDTERFLETFLDEKEISCRIMTEAVESDKKPNKQSTEMQFFNFLFTHSCLEFYLMSVIWTCHNLEYNFGMKHKFTDYLNESCRYYSD